MAALNEIQGGIVLTQFANPTGVPVWETLVCEQDATFTNGMDITEEKTKCGSAVALSDPSWSASGTAVANSQPTTGFVSYATVQYWMNEKVKRKIRVQSAADVALSLDEGEAFYHEGEGYITDVSFNYGNGQVVKFDWTFSGQGNLKTSNLDILTQPTSTSKTVGQSTTFTVVASGGVAPVTFQWYKNGVALVGNGATTATWSKTAALIDAGTYTCVVTDAYNNSVTSNGAVLTVS